MPLGRFSLEDIRSDAALDRWARSTNVKPSANSVDTGTVDGASDAADGTFYGKRAGVLSFDEIQLTDLPDDVATDLEVSAAAASAQAAAEATAAAELDAHVAAGDPHPVYLTATEGNALYQPLAAALSRIYTGTATPEGVVTAPVGSLFLRQDGGAGTTLYVKESGAGNTGWVGK